MKNHSKLNHWIYSTIATLAIAGSASLGHAQTAISYTFNTDIQSWDAGGNGTVAWNSTNGVGGGGCLEVTFDGTTTTETDPGVAVAINTAQYFTVEMDMMVDPNSGTTGIGGSGGYGNLQMVMRDASFSWDSSWHGAIYPPAASSYVHYTFTIAQPFKTEARLQFQLQGSAGYSAPVTVYIDNVKVTPLPNPWIIDAFTNDTSATYGWANWSTAGTAAWNTSQDAGGGQTPPGALQMDIAFTSGWQQCWFGHEPSGFSMDPSRFTYWECDVMVDAANSTPNNDGSYGDLEFNIRDGAWGDHACSPSGVTLDSSYTSWKHVKLALPVITSSVGFDIEAKGSHMGPIRIYMDNIKLTKPTTLPKIGGLVTAGPSGTKITLNGAGNQWDRQAICVPAGTSTAVNYTWGGQTPATYSLSITNFPAPADAPGFEGHIFIISGYSGYDETVGSADWNAANLAVLRVENGTNGGVVASFEWKTNSPGSNPPTNNVTAAQLPSLASANGTWSLNFTDDTHGNIVGPNGLVVTNFTLDADTAAIFTAPAASFVQFGAFKNDSLNTGKSDNKGYILTHVLVTNANGTIFNDNFSAGLTNNYAWRVSSAAAITSIPQGTAFWLQWSVPDNGFTAQSAASLTGTWGDAGITYIYTDTTGTNRLGAVPAVNLPVGNNAFFRLINTNAP